MMSKKTVNLDFPIMDISGKELGKETTGQVIAHSLSLDKESKDPLKWMVWATAFYKGESVDMDESDFKTFKDWFESRSFPPITKVPVIKHLESL